MSFLRVGEINAYASPFHGNTTVPAWANFRKPRHRIPCITTYIATKIDISPGSLEYGIAHGIARIPGDITLSKSSIASAGMPGLARFQHSKAIYPDTNWKRVAGVPTPPFYGHIYFR